MKNKSLLIILYSILALPIPFSLLSWIGTLITVANMGEVSSVWAKIISVSAMVAVGIYPVTYGICLGFTVKKKRLGFLGWLPLLHIVFAGALLTIWSMS